MSPQYKPMSQSFYRPLWLSIYFATLLWSAIEPADRITWLLEVSPAVFGLIALALTYRVFPLTRLVYLLILIHCLILMFGGHYTYAQVPLFNWLSDAMGWHRNNYDKLGHFAQGFVPAMIIREIVIRRNLINGRGWINFFILATCLAISALYELIEWLAATFDERAAESFLGTQGYIWDTQSDMAFALAGAMIALLLLSKTHDRALALIAKKDPGLQPSSRA